MITIILFLTIAAWLILGINTLCWYLSIREQRQRRHYGLPTATLRAGWLDFAALLSLAWLMATGLT